MMEKFRNLSNNIFFKIFLGFVGLSFVMFGISGFILGSNSAWVAKVGKKTISVDSFNKELQKNKEAIARNVRNEDLSKLESEEFKQNVLDLMINKELVNLLQTQLKIYPDKDLIFAQIIKDPQLQDKNGKFDRNLYLNLLKNASITEEDQIKNISNQMFVNMIISSLMQKNGSNPIMAKQLYDSRFEHRIFDTITISADNLLPIKAPNDFDLNGFFEKNKEQFALPEVRRVSFISFDRSNLKEKVEVSEEEITKEYEENKNQYQIPELRSFYHILFSSKKEADEFIQSLKIEAKNSNEETAFEKLAIAKGKDKSTIFLDKISKKYLSKESYLSKELAESAFSLAKNTHSEALKSPLGFHIFYLKEIQPASEIPLAEVKNKIKSKISKYKEDKQLVAKMQSIEDEILSTNSINKVAEKFGFKINNSLPKFDIEGRDSKKQLIKEVNNFDDFVKNSFALEQGRVSKVFSSKTNDKYYIISIDEVEKSRKRSLDEVKALVTDLWVAEKIQENLGNFANKIIKEINNGGSVNEIVTKNKLLIKKNLESPRFYIRKDENGRILPYQDQSLKNIFKTDVNKATILDIGQKKIIIAVIKEIKTPKNDQKVIEKIEKIDRSLQDNFRNDVFVSLDQYIKSQFPIEINKKIIKSSAKTSDK